MKPISRAAEALVEAIRRGDIDPKLASDLARELSLAGDQASDLVIRASSDDRRRARGLASGLDQARDVARDLAFELATHDHVRAEELVTVLASSLAEAHGLALDLAGSFAEVDPLAEGLARAGESLAVIAGDRPMRPTSTPAALPPLSRPEP